VNYNWHWKVLLETEAGGTELSHYLIVAWAGLSPPLLQLVIALAIGALVGTLRTTPLKWQCEWAISTSRSFATSADRADVPVVLRRSELLPKGWVTGSSRCRPPWSSYLPAVLCLGIFTSVRVAEQVRAGSIPCRAVSAWPESRWG